METTPQLQGSTKHPDPMKLDSSSTPSWVELTQGEPLTNTATWSSEIPPQQPRKKRGCRFWWCMTVIWLVVLFLLIIVVGVFVARKKLVHWWVENTSTRPLVFETYQLDNDKKQKTLEDFLDITRWLEYGGTWTYQVDESQVNYLLSTTKAKDLVHVWFDGSDIVFSVSAWLAEIENEQLQGKYFNAIVRTNIAYERGDIDAYILDVDLPDGTLPSDAIRGLSKQDLWPWLQAEEDLISLLEYVDSFYVSGDLLYLTLRE